eukprot:gene1251-1657_t
MLVFGAGTALAGLAGVIGGSTFLTEPSMAATVGSVIFVVVVVGGMGSLSGAFLASILIGTIQTFAVAFDYSVGSVAAQLGIQLSAAAQANTLTKLTLSQVAPILPYLFLVLILIFRPRGLLGTLFALLLALAPLVFTSGLSITMLSQMGIAIIACLSYNILLGQGGMLSFGHAVYTGLGSFLAIHALNMASAGSLPLPVSLVPVVGGLAGMFFAALLGWVTTRKSGTTFAMITLGIGELVFAMSLMIPEFFGGEGGINANRVVGKPFMGISFGPPIQVYYLIAVYTFVAVALMFAFTRTPL